LSIILICRFFLDIRQRNDHPNGTSQSSQPVGSFHAVAQRIHTAVVEEFGDPSFELRDMDSHHKEAVVDLENFPWATEVSSQQAQPVPSGVQQIHTSDILTHIPNRMRQ